MKKARIKISRQYYITRTLTLEPHTACRKGGWGLEYKIKRN